MRKGRILIVEDEAGVRDVNAAHLAGLGYEVYTAATLAQAERLAQETPPDLYLLDVMLPDGSGLDYCRRLRRYSTAPVVFLTCLGESSDIIRGIEEGGDAYLTKPYDLGVLAAQVSAQLRRSGLMGVGRVELPPSDGGPGPGRGGAGGEGHPPVPEGGPAAGLPGRKRRAVLHPGAAVPGGVGRGGGHRRGAQVHLHPPQKNGAGQIQLH